MKLALVVAALAFILAAVAPNPAPLVVLGLFAAFVALWASERCHRGQSDE